ncbi:MAG: DsbA family protein [Proteobacteria bacterium]|nr:DsbA family protein [Pseudomonadota bacterium]
MTHRDRAGDPPGRREAAGDAGHRQGFPTPAGGSPARSLWGIINAPWYKRLGAVEAYSRRLFQAIFVEGGAIAEADLIGFAEDVGLDAQAFRTRLEDPATAELHEAALQEAHRRGAFGVPTFFVGKRLFWGNDRLPLVAHFIRMARAGGPA